MFIKRIRKKRYFEYNNICYSIVSRPFRLYESLNKLLIISGPCSYADFKIK